MLYSWLELPSGSEVQNLPAIKEPQETQVLSLGLEDLLGLEDPLQYSWTFLVAPMVKNSRAMQETWVWSLGWEDPVEEGMAIQISCLENPMDRGVWWATVHRIAKSQTWLKWLSTRYKQFYTIPLPGSLFSFCECVYIHYIHTWWWWFSCFSCVQLFVTPWMVACQAPLSMGFSRQEYWSRRPFPSPGNLFNLDTEHRSPTS